LRLELLAAKIQLFREISAESSQIFISVKSQYVKERFLSARAFYALWLNLPQVMSSRRMDV